MKMGKKVNPPSLNKQKLLFFFFFSLSSFSRERKIFYDILSLLPVCLGPKFFFFFTLLFKKKKNHTNFGFFRFFFLFLSLFSGVTNYFV